VFFSIKVEGLWSEPNMGMYSDAAGEEFIENGRVSANEVDGTKGDLEGFPFLGDDRDGHRLGGLGFEQVLEVEKRPQVLFLLNGVVNAPISDKFDSGVHQGLVVGQ
jgi:hypothetical protein